LTQSVAWRNKICHFDEESEHRGIGGMLVGHRSQVVFTGAMKILI